MNDPSDARRLTIKRNTIAVVTDGSAVLGLGNIGPLAALPVMEGKAALFKRFANIDAFPICLDTQDLEEIVRTVKMNHLNDVSDNCDVSHSNESNYSEEDSDLTHLGNDALFFK